MRRNWQVRALVLVVERHQGEAFILEQSAFVESVPAMRWLEARGHGAQWSLISIENISALWQFPTARYIFFA